VKKCLTLSLVLKLAVQDVVWERRLDLNIIVVGIL